MDFRKTFDSIPENFDKYRPRYWNHDLYSGVAVENGVIFTKLEEF